MTDVSAAFVLASAIAALQERAAAADDQLAGVSEAEALEQVAA